MMAPDRRKSHVAEQSTFPEPRRRTESARLELAKLPADTPLAHAFARACELAADAIGVARVGVWLFVDDRLALRCATLFERDRREHSTGAILRVADFPTYFSSLVIRKAVPAEVAAADPRTAELNAAYLQPLGISSMLDAGLFIGGDLIGVVCHEHVGPPREWTTEDRDFAGSIADLLAVRIQSAEAADLRAVLRTTESRMTMLEKAEALEQLAAGLAHDFRNLLTVVVAGGDLLSRRADLNDDAKDIVAAMLEAARKGVNLSNELTEFSKPSNRPPAVLDLAEVTGEFLGVLKAAVGPAHPIEFTRPPALGKVLTDRGQFTRVLLNLTVNAKDALPQGGPIRVQLSPVRVGGQTGPPGHYVMLEVADRGSGMDEVTKKKAFDPFFTTKEKGTGVGLAVVRRVADRAGGFVRIASEPGKGTAIRVFFPRVGTSSGGTQEYTALGAD
jgi:two-component system, cell cycle sensor histidine kinase and response regulator CckA